MSNQITLVRTQFTDTNTSEKDVSYGYRIYDNYASSYRMYVSGKAPDDDAFLLKDAAEAGDDIAPLIEWAEEHGIRIDDTFYDKDDVKDMLK